MILPYRSSGTTTAVCQARLQKVPMVRLMGSVRRMARREILVMVGMEEFQVLLIFPKYKARALVTMTKVAECTEECDGMRGGMRGGPRDGMRGGMELIYICVSCSYTCACEYVNGCVRVYVRLCMSLNHHHHYLLLLFLLILLH